MNNKAKTLAAIINFSSLPLLANPLPNAQEVYVVTNAATQKQVASFSYPDGNLALFTSHDLQGIGALISSLANRVGNEEAKNRAVQLKAMSSRTIDKALAEYRTNNVHASSELAKEFNLERSDVADGNLLLELLGLYLHAVKDFKDAENGDGTTVHVSRGTFI